MIQFLKNTKAKKRYAYSFFAGILDLFRLGEVHGLQLVVCPANGICNRQRDIMTTAVWGFTLIKKRKILPKEPHVHLNMM